MTAQRPFRGSSSRLVVLAALAVLAGLLPGTASADPQRGLLVVEGQGNRSAVVELPEGAQLRPPRPVLTGGDRYAGVVIESLSDASWPVLTALVVRAFRDDTSAAQGFYGLPSLEPGRYRVTLLGDAPVRAEWQLNDPEQPGIAVAPRTPVVARFLGRAEPLPADWGAARVDMPRALPAGKRALQVMTLVGTRVDEVMMCATAEDSCPRRTLPACPPSPAPCAVGDTAVPNRYSTGEASMNLIYNRAATDVRALRWAVEGYREEPDRLRAAAIIF